MTGFGFDGFERGKAPDGECSWCEVPLHEHDKKRVYPDDGPAGSYHYKYLCPDS